MTYLDTHVVAWLYNGDLGKLSRGAEEHVRAGDTLISPMVVLELQFLFDIGRARAPANKVIETLAKDMGVAICQLPFALVIEHSLGQKWVRDPFDRLIVAHAAANDAVLVTKDENIRRHYKRAIW